MNLKALILALCGLYVVLNFISALMLHLHAERQAHLRVRSLDVLMHFVLLTLFGVPVLLVILAEALFGGHAEKVTSTRQAPPPPSTVSHAGARAA